MLPLHQPATSACLHTCCGRTAFVLSPLSPAQPPGWARRVPPFAARLWRGLHGNPIASAPQDACLHPAPSLRHLQASRLGRKPQRSCAHLSASACTASCSYAPAGTHLSSAHTYPSSPLQTLRRHCRGGICRLCLQRAFSPCMLHIVVSQPESELPSAFCRLDRALSLVCSPARQPAPLWPILRATPASAETALVLGSPARYPRASPRPSPQLCPSRQRRASKRRPLDALALVPRSPSCPHPANPFLNPVPCTVFAWSEVPGRTRGA